MNLRVLIAVMRSEAWFQPSKGGSIMKYSFGIQRMAKFVYIEEIFNTAIQIYPNLKNMLRKVKLSPFWKSDGLTRYVWRYGKKVYLLPCTISINIQIFWSRNYDVSNLKGITWHEIGHVLSWLICLQDHRFFINQKGLLEYNWPIKEIEDEDLPERIRDHFLDAFWERERKKYGHFQVVSLEQILKPSPHNSSELLAESFKYAFAGEGHIEEELFVLVKNIVDDFISEFVRHKI